MPSFIWDSTIWSYRNLKTGSIIHYDYGRKIADEAVRIAFGLSKDSSGNEIVPPSAVTNPAGRVNWSYTEMSTGVLGAPSVSSPNWKVIGKNISNAQDDLYTYTQLVPQSSWDDNTQGDKAMAEIELPLYYQAKADAEAMTKPMNTAGSRITRLPALKRMHYANCSGFTSSVIIRMVDPHYPGALVDNQVPYLNSAQSQGIWQLVGYTRNDQDNTTKEYNPSLYQPGDVFITHRPYHTHTFIWVGEHKGFTDVIAEAAFASVNSTGLTLPRLHRIQKSIRDTGVDSSKRPYQIWRFMGGVYTPNQDALVTRVNTANIFTNPRAVLRGPVSSGQLNSGSVVDVSLDMTIPTGVYTGQQVFLTTESPFVLNVEGNGQVKTAAGLLVANVSVVADDNKSLVVKFARDGPRDIATVQFTASFESGYTGSADEQQFELGNLDDTTDFSAPITYTIT